MTIFEFRRVNEFHPMEVYLAKYSNVKRTNKKTEEKTGMKKNPVEQQHSAGVRPTHLQIYKEYMLRSISMLPVCF